jgi:tetratricopeptide (TPR) repeat protein
MAMRAHDQVVVGIFAAVVLAVIGGAVTVVGFHGSGPEILVSNALKNADGALRQAFPSLETLAKLAGLAITLLSGAYAIYQKLYFAERNMRTRLREFLQKVESRLKDSNAHMAKAVQRPSPDRKFESPIFTDETLNPVLKRMKWGKRPRADESLQATLDELEKQLDLWHGQKREYEQRMAQACLLKGAIAAARAANKEGDEARKDNVEALEYFQEAFELSDKKDAAALEYIGHQQVRLGEYASALTTFQQLADIAPQGKSLLRARALKFQAEVYECRPSPNWGRANGVFIDAVNNALPANAPDLEKAEIRVMQGRVR